MIAHIVLFQPRADLSSAERARFTAAFEHALSGIPQVRRARIGERKILNRPYDRLNAREFAYLAILEFDSISDLQVYLDHPAHEELGQRFYEMAEAALAYDFNLSEGADIARVLRS